MSRSGGRMFSREIFFHATAWMDDPNLIIKSVRVLFFRKEKPPGFRCRAVEGVLNLKEDQPWASQLPGWDSSQVLSVLASFTRAALPPAASSTMISGWDPMVACITMQRPASWM